MVTKIVHGNHPFTEGGIKDKPIHVYGDKVGAFIYPDWPANSLEFSDLNLSYVMAQGLTVCTYELGPGGYFSPPDYHPGDEPYIVLEGTLTMLNNESGQVVRVKKGEGILLPKGAVHSGYNFENEKVRVLAMIAPKVVEDQAFPTDKAGCYKLFQGAGNDAFEKFPPKEYPHRMGTLDDLYSWPVSGPEAREYPHHLYHVPEDRKLLCIHGQENPVLFKFTVSNDFIHVAQVRIPSGGKGCRMSDPICLAGKAVIYVDDDAPVTIFVRDTQEIFYLRAREALYLPEKTTFTILNYENTAKEFVLVANAL